MLIAVVLFWVVSLCQAEDSLKAKLSKLEATLESQQSAQKSTNQAKDSKATTAKILSSERKTLAEKIDELKAQQKSMQGAYEGMDSRVSEVERKLQLLETQLEQREPTGALASKVGKLEQKMQTLEDVLESLSVKQDSDVKLSNTVSKLEQHVQTSTIQPSASAVEPVPHNLMEEVSTPVVADPDDIWQRETLTNGFGGLNDALADSGIEIGLSMTNIYQSNIRGGMNTNQKRGQHTGSYDLEIGADLQQLCDIEGGSLLVHTEGSWSRFDVDETSVGSMFGVNGDGAGRRAMDVTEVWYEQAMFDETLRLRLGKMDIGGGFECRGCPVSFDGSLYANDETGQFLNGALVNNPTIPMPDMGLGAVVYWNPVEWWYASIGAIDAQADARESGFRTAFHGEDNFFYVAETGLAPQFDSGKGPMSGAYRVGIWNDPQEKESFSNGEIRRDDTGIYISADQMVYKENDGPEDSQGLGVFTRYGMANKKVNDISDFWSFGFQYQGLLEGRDDDVLGLGLAKGIFSTEAGYSREYESVVELYYSAQIAPWIAISPSLQFVENPGGDDTVDDSIVFGLRAQSSF